jgi:hypothetical protein
LTTTAPSDLGPVSKIAFVSKVAPSNQVALEAPRFVQDVTIVDNGPPAVPGNPGKVAICFWAIIYNFNYRPSRLLAERYGSPFLPTM